MGDTTIANQENDLLQLATFGIGEEEYGIDILKVQEIGSSGFPVGSPDQELAG